MFSRAQVRRILRRVPGKQRLEGKCDSFRLAVETVRLSVSQARRRSSIGPSLHFEERMMSTVEKPQKDSIKEGWKMNETKLQQSIK
ncbi:uncharacterized protein LOC128592256 isoform X1 [Nycticebus coucang]|uniref:uncharacterized protein LOC128592256 isoform X1 n=1 Tax=Nycticebus coucang TaxID=9470 RepID=UPI00234CA4B1|nr:uncharacterized protein LOC128592256 isoform X1 [Nycticebus coucang]